jgi:hypothetical protein
VPHDFRLLVFLCVCYDSIKQKSPLPQ